MTILKIKGFTVAAALALAACSSAPDKQMSAATPAAEPAGPVTRCEGSEWVDNSSIAVLPVPVVAFFVPHAETNDIEEHTYTARCGDKARLANEKVQVSKAACIPAGLTRIITLGVWQWCPAHVNWEADVH